MNFICCPVELCLNLKPLLLRVLASLTVLILHFTFAIAQPAPCPKDTLAKSSFQIRSTLELQDPAKKIYEVKLYLYRDSPDQSKLTSVHIDLPLKYALNQPPNLSLKDSVGLFNSDGKGSCTFQLSADGKTIAADLRRPGCEGGIKGEGYLGSFLIKGGNSLIRSGANRFHDGIVEVVIIHGIRPGPDASENERRREGVQVFPQSNQWGYPYCIAQRGIRKDGDLWSRRADLI